jgi:hypothetical protein
LNVTDRSGPLMSLAAPPQIDDTTPHDLPS